MNVARWRRNIGLSAVAGLVLLGLQADTALADSAPALTREQIEAEWLHTDEVRTASAPLALSGAGAKPDEDALGGVDGKRDGKWGFHTQSEQRPWWQVDLGSSQALDRAVLYNRCDLAERNSRILVLLSDDGKSFRQAYQHDGSVFYGFTDKKPLVVKLDGQSARYVRLQHPGTSYFHLDEVEVYAAGGTANIALGKPATQSSVSQWSARHTVSSGPVEPAYRTAEAIQRGLRLAESLRQRNVNVEAPAAALRQAAARLPQIPAGDTAGGRSLYLEVRRTVRQMLLADPLLDFDSIVFVKRAPGVFPHMSDQFYGWFSRPGGGVCVLEGFKTSEPRVRCLTGDMPEGNFLTPELSYDGKKILFSYCRYYPDVSRMAKVDKEELPEDAFYHLFEMNLDGTGRRQVTRGRYDDFSGKYLPNGEIVFLSTRKGVSIQCSRQSAQATLQTGVLPDSYVRCGGGQTRPVAVFTLHAIDAAGENVRPISAFENFEWDPSVGSDGRIFYARWDYIDRFNGPFISLWSTNPDGSNTQLVYGNYTTRPQCVFEPRAIPGSNKLLVNASAHHSITGGSLLLLDRTRGTEEETPLSRLTPEVPFPETEAWVNSYYTSAYPLSESLMLTAWSDRRLPPHCYVDDSAQNPRNALGLYLYDASGNLEPLYRDADLSSQYPLPVRPRPKPPVLPHLADLDGAQEGRFLLQDVYQGLGNVPAGTIKSLRVVAVLPKVQPEMNTPSLGVSHEETGKFVLGTVPVESDGSAHLRLPSGLPVFFQALDAEGMTVQTMRSLAYVMPGQTQSCIGCHESRDSSPPVLRAPLAALREPSKLTPGPEGTWPLRFDRLVQPVLDRHCIACHRPDSDQPKAAKLDLRAPAAYGSLLAYGGDDLKKLAMERPRSIPGDCPSRQSKLLALLRHADGHAGVKLDADSLQRLITWMDVYAQPRGSFSDDQDRELEELRQQWSGFLTTR